ncbi:hypothetical protein B0H12DRAFT_91367 [Mycena haematopus]|nr:hypothetical protein B0H12DRAFT_91367 [Mycena haematopus]
MIRLSSACSACETAFSEGPDYSRDRVTQNPCHVRLRPIISRSGVRVSLRQCSAGVRSGFRVLGAAANIFACQSSSCTVSCVGGLSSGCYGPGQSDQPHYCQRYLCDG